MKNDASQGSASSAKRNIEAVYPLSPMQQGMLFHSLYAPETGAYFEQFTCVLRGRLNRTAFEQAWQIIVQRQAVLRTSFVWKRLDRMLQVVQKEVNLPVEYQDWRAESPQAQGDHLDAYLSADRKRGFDLAKSPLMRLALLQIEDDAHYFAWSHHHALMDGWSMPLLLKEVLYCYETLAQGKSPYLPPARPYREYINWLQKQDPASAEAYWRGLLRGLDAPTHLIYDPFASQKSSNLEEEIHLSKELTASLGALARRERLTLSTLIQAAWALLLSRYSGEQDVLFGATVSGRPADLAGAESIIGLFINTLPVRVQVTQDTLLVDWLRQIQEQALSTRQFEYSALTQIQEWSEIPRGTPLFESILVFENYPVEDALRSALPQQAGSAKEGGGAGGAGFAERLKIEQVHSYEQTNFPLTVVSGPGESLGIKISYDPGRFSPGTILRMLGHLEMILAGFVSEMNRPAFSNRRLADISILTTEEEKVLDGFAQMVKFPEGWIPGATWLDPNAPPDTIHHLFELQASLTPDAIALVLDESALLGGSSAVTRPLQMTYAELNASADALAGYLMQQGIGPEALVGVYTNRSFEMVIGILGILKAGGAYLPLDPNYPLERISYMLKDAAVSLVLTQAHLLERLPDELRAAYTPLAMDTEWDKIQPNSENPLRNTSQVAGPQNLAYVIYTSGSTGKPKGVMIEHHSLVNLVRNNIAVTNLTPADKVLQFLSFGFDASGEEIFPPLVCGASLVLPASAREIAPLDLCEVIERQQISTVHLPVAYWHQMVDELEAESRPAPVSLRLLIAGGESPAIGKLRTWFRLNNDNPVDFINAYGPTETTIAATYYRIRSDQHDRLAMDRLPIGYGLANNQIWILDSALQPVPINVPGEICIAGAGVARGYLNQPELTAEKFIPAPGLEPSKSSALSGERRMYRTGDQGRFWPDGTIEFVGRVDQQVKIRGYRIELGEIEAVLSHHPSVQSVVVQAIDWQTPGNGSSAAASTKRLVAYVQPQKEAGGLKENTGELRQYLLENLPEYMVPAVFVFLESFPLTPNGKIDRRALPMPAGLEIGRTKAYVLPRTPVESLVAGVWEQVLGVSPVGAEDNFFELGGHSLVATQVVSRLRNVFQVEIPLREVFENPTVAGLSFLIETNLREGAGLAQPVIEPLPRVEAGDSPVTPPQLSFSQQRLWFLDQLAPGNLFYNLPLAVEIGGALDISALQRTINEIIARHAILRTNFQAAGGVPVQIIHPAQPLDLPVTDLSGLPESEARAQARQFAQEEARKSFDLQKDTLVRARLFRLSDDRHVFLLTMHHIVSDGWSMGVFIREVAVLYAAFAGGKPSPLPPLRIQYFDYAEWQRDWLQGEQLDRQVNYWKKQLASAPRLLELPTDHPRPAVQSSRGATLAFSLPAELNRKVNELCRQEGVTLFMAYLAAFQVLLSRYSGQEDISVGTAIANRTNADIENLIGFFVNTLVMRVDLSAEPDFKEVLKRVRNVALGAYAHQDLPFETLVEVLQPERNLSHTPLFQVAFALQNAPMSDAVRSLNQGRSGEGLTFELIESDSGSAKFDLTLTLAETPNGIVGGLEYNLDLFEPATIERMVVHYQTLIENALADLERPVSQLGLLSQAEQQRLLIDWNVSAAPTPGF
ncbi:MAG: amino acid adenylation domain-containing protein [Anaerolineales bacterium]|nr:amino acid adenylation domain-containing protein [Anaerolineales bacterium]